MGSVEHLSVHITAEKSGWFLDQGAYCQDLPAKWSMAECRASGSLEDARDQLGDEADQGPDATMRVKHRGWREGSTG